MDFVVTAAQLRAMSAHFETCDTVPPDTAAQLAAFAAAEIERLQNALTQSEKDTILLNKLDAMFEDNAYIAVDDGEGEVRFSATEYADLEDGAVPHMSGRESLAEVVEQLEHREDEWFRKMRAENEFGHDEYERWNDRDISGDY